MKSLLGKWEKLGRILHPDAEIGWMFGYTGSAVAVPTRSPSRYEVFVTGRDNQNRSTIGRFFFDPENPMDSVEIDPTPVFTPGTLGAFDENGVSYPSVVQEGDRLYLYYTGWMPTVLTPFQNHLGLAVRSNKGGDFIRASRAPILPRTNDDFLSTGAVYVMKEENEWRMWYTSFVEWGTRPGQPKHSYVIKYAHSKDGISWERENRVCIGLRGEGEHSISRPSVLKFQGLYHMWYCSRGEDYKIGYAVSRDGLEWDRRDAEVGLTLSSEGWDSQGQAYPYVFLHKNDLYMLYCGNHYGRDGLGLARMKLA